MYWPLENRCLDRRLWLRNIFWEFRHRLCLRNIFREFENNFVTLKSKFAQATTLKRFGSCMCLGKLVRKCLVYYRSYWLLSSITRKWWLEEYWGILWPQWNPLMFVLLWWFHIASWKLGNVKLCINVFQEQNWPSSILMKYGVPVVSWETITFQNGC